MIALDTNILVYSHRAESRFHDQALKLMRHYAEGQERWAIPWPCIYEFFSVVTNPRIWKDAASTPDQASQQINAWFETPSLLLLHETDDFPVILDPVMRSPRVRGEIIHDARIAALCLAHGVSELLTKDRDFSLFPQLKIRDPLLTQ